MSVPVKHVGFLPMDAGPMQIPFVHRCLTPLAIHHLQIFARLEYGRYM